MFVMRFNLFRLLFKHLAFIIRVNKHKSCVKSLFRQKGSGTLICGSLRSYHSLTGN